MLSLNQRLSTNSYFYEESELFSNFLLNCNRAILSCYVRVLFQEFISVLILVSLVPRECDFHMMTCEELHSGRSG